MMDPVEASDAVEFEGELEYDDDELLREMEDIVSDLFVFYEKWIETRSSSIKEIREMAKDLHACQKNIDITKVIGACVGASATLSGACLTGIGIALGPCSCNNRSGQFMKMGLAAGILGGIGVSTSLVATTVKNSTERHRWKRFREIIEADSITTQSLKSVISRYNRTLKSLQNITAEKEASSLPRNIVQVVRGANRLATGISKIVLKAGLARTKMAALILPSTRAVVKVSQILSAISLVLGGISLILDIIYLVQVSIHIHDGSRSEVARKMEEIADVMDAELCTIKRYMVQISLQDRNEDNLSDIDSDIDSDDGFYDSLLLDDRIWADSLHLYQNADVQSDRDSEADDNDVIAWSHDNQDTNQNAELESESFAVHANEEMETKEYASVDRELYRLTPQRLLSDFEDVF